MAGTTQLEAGNGDGEYTQDGTTDLHSNPIFRSQRGVWRACSFVVVYEVFERLAYNGISSNLVLYLTTQLHQGTVSSANNVTNWVGTTWMTPIISAYIADAHLGRYRTFMVASVIYLYYAFFAVLNCASLLLFFAVCRMYVYNVEPEVTHINDRCGEKQRVSSPNVGAADVVL